MMQICVPAVVLSMATDTIDLLMAHNRIEGGYGLNMKGDGRQISGLGGLAAR